MRKKTRKKCNIVSENLIYIVSSEGTCYIFILENVGVPDETRKTSVPSQWIKNYPIWILRGGQKGEEGALDSFHLN